MFPGQNALMHPSFLTPRFFMTHCILPLAAFLLAAVVLELSLIDLRFAGLLFRVEGDGWLWRDAWLTRTLIHDGGRLAVALMALVMLGLLLFSLLHPAMSRWRKALLYLSLATLTSGILINVLKQLTHVDCPWDLQQFGGSEIYIRNFLPLPDGKQAGRCFPAGHASAAWSWFGLYYFACVHAWNIRKRVLWVVLTSGLVFALAQEFRGAHFLSHDVWTLGICWLISTLFFMLFYLPKPQQYRGIPSLLRAPQAGGNTVDST